MSGGNKDTWYAYNDAQAERTYTQGEVDALIAAERMRLRAAIEAKRCTPMFPGGHSFNYGIEAAVECVKA